MEIRKVKKKPMKIRRAKEQSIKVKTDSIKLAGVQGAKSATRQIEDGTEVSQTVLYINVKLKNYEDMIFVYGLNEEKVKIAGQIKNDLMSN